MRYPDFLKDNGTIGFVAPSFGCTVEPYTSATKHAIELFESAGYKTKMGPNCYKSDGVGISSSPENCAKEIMDFWTDESVDIMLSCGGGELMCEILPYLDFDKLKTTKPKWFMGYSDNTNLGFLLATICETASIYGPNAPAFGMEPRHESVNDAWEMLHGSKLTMKSYKGWQITSLKDAENPLAPYNITEDSTLQYGGSWDKAFSDIQGQSFEGRMIGGCLDCLSNFCGTGFDQVAEFVERHREEGIIWFLESCELGIMSIRRALWQLEQAGWFKYTKGFVIGRPMLFEIEDYGMDRYSVVRSVLDKYNVPIVLDVDLGHLPPAMPLINGSYAKVTALDEKEISIEMKLK